MRLFGLLLMITLYNESCIDEDMYYVVRYFIYVNAD